MANETIPNLTIIRQLNSHLILWVTFYSNLIINLTITFKQYNNPRLSGEGVKKNLHFYLSIFYHFFVILSDSIGNLHNLESLQNRGYVQGRQASISNHYLSIYTQSK
jgi:hypothetical protein